MILFPFPVHRTMAEVMRDEFDALRVACEQETLAEDTSTAASARTLYRGFGCEAQAPEGSSGASASKGSFPANACEARATPPRKVSIGSFWGKRP